MCRLLQMTVNMQDFYNMLVQISYYLLNVNERGARAKSVALGCRLTGRAIEPALAMFAMYATRTYVHFLISPGRMQPCSIQKQQLYAIHNTFFPFHQVPITAGWPVC